MPPFPVHGGDGVELAQWWDANRFQAYEGVSVPGFPNMFLILGPYGFNGASYFTLIENQARHIVRCLRRARADRLDRGRGQPRGQPALLRDDALPPRPPGLLHQQLRRRRTATTSTRAATRRSARRRRSRSPGTAPTSTSTTTASARCLSRRRYSPRVPARAACESSGTAAGARSAAISSSSSRSCSRRSLAEVLGPALARSR